jgi:MFS family permease
LPALSIRRANLRRALRIVTMAWMFGIVWGTLVGGDQTRILGDMLGFQDWHFSLLIALPPLATVGQILSVILIERTGLRKYQFMEFGAIARLLWLAVAALPLVFVLPSAAAIYAMMMVLLTSSFCDALATPAWFSWMAQLIPRRVRGRYFAVRQRLTQYVQIVTVIVASAILDAVTVPHDAAAPITAGSQPALLRAVCIMFAIAAVFGTMDILLFRGIRDVLPSVLKSTKVAPASLRILLDPLKNHVFRNYVLFGATLTFSNAVGGWFYWKNCRENLGFSSLATSMLFLVLTPIIQIFCVSWWGRIIDRWGRRPVLIIGGVGVVITMIPYMIASPRMGNPAFVADAVNWLTWHFGTAINWAGHLVGIGRDLVGLHWVDYHTPISSYLIILSAIIVGAAAWAGVNLATNAIVLGFAEGHGRSNFVAAQSFFISMGGLLGAVVAMFSTHHLESLHKNPILVGPFLWNGWHIMFLLAMLSRICSLFWLRGMPDPGAASVGNLLRSVRTNFYGGVTSVVLFPLRVFGWRPGGAGGEGHNHDARD